MGWSIWDGIQRFGASGENIPRFGLLKYAYDTFGFWSKHTAPLAFSEHIPRFWLLENTYHAFGFWRNHTTLMVSGVNIPQFCFPEKTYDLSTSEENIPRFGLVENIPGF